MVFLNRVDPFFACNHQKSHNRPYFSWFSLCSRQAGLLEQAIHRIRQVLASVVYQFIDLLTGVVIDFFQQNSLVENFVERSQRVHMITDQRVIRKCQFHTSCFEFMSQEANFLDSEVCMCTHCITKTGYFGGYAGLACFELVG